MAPAGAVKDVGKAKIALVTTSGVVPWGNPDGFKTFRNTFWRKYPVAELKTMEPGMWEAVHGGYNVASMNANPLYGVPLDALRELQQEGKYEDLYPAYYVIPGNQGSPAAMAARGTGDRRGAQGQQRGRRAVGQHVRHLQSQRSCD